MIRYLQRVSISDNFWLGVILMILSLSTSWILVLVVGVALGLFLAMLGLHESIEE